MTEVRAELVGSVWKIEKEAGDQVAEDDTLLILESMKMEIPVESPVDGIVSDMRVQEGAVVQEGDVIAVVG